MNERIKELMEQAKRPLGELKPKMANTGAKWDMVLDPELFAELIVKECLNNMNNKDGDLDFAIWKTKNDFGIE